MDKNDFQLLLINNIEKRVNDCENAIVILYRKIKDMKEELHRIRRSDLYLVDEILNSPGQFDLECGKPHPMKTGET